MEIRSIRLELQQKKDTLLYADHTVADKRLTDFLNFLDTNPLISKILIKLPATNINWEEWEQNLWSAMDYGFPEEEDLTARMCYDVLKRYRGQSLINIAVNFHTGSNNITDHEQKYFETFVPFLFEYLDKKLSEAETLISPTDMVNEIQEIVDETTLEKYPDIHTRLIEVYKKLYVAETNDDYRGIASICRGIITDFASIIFDPTYLPPNTPAPQEDNAKDKLKYTYRHFAKKKKTQYQDAKLSIILETWNLVCACVHRKNIQTSEIKECVLFTYLIINTFIHVSEEK
jgi:hypothetical protein